MTRFAAWLARLPLWARLAVFAVIGVAFMHAAYLPVASELALSALAQQQEALGRSLGRLAARQAADAILVDDSVALSEIVTSVMASGPVSYCLIQRGGEVLASSFPGGPPPGLVQARAGRAGPLVMRSGSDRHLDIAAPILDGHAGMIRVGLDLRELRATRRKLAILLGLIGLGVMAAGLIAALVVGHSMARPVDDLLAAADHFDPGAAVRPVSPRGAAEFVRLADRFNQMMARLKAAHEEQERVRQKSVETERLVALGSLLAGVAHEVNNPLAGLKNCHRRLERGDLSGERQREYLELMGDAIDRIEDVMQRLLDFGRPRPLRLDAERPSALLREGARLIQPTLRKRGIRWTQILDGESPGARVLADRRQVGQALLNLILNAAYVTPEGGEIRARLRARPGFLGISIEDDGPGIPVEIRGRILDPFFSTKPAGEGTGLGLSVTRAIVDAHGGEMTFEFSARGTVVTLWLRPADGGGGGEP